MAVSGTVASSCPRFARERLSDCWRSSLHLSRLLICALLLTASATCFGVTTYAYDSAKRLTSVSYVDGTQIRYGYDAAGNIVSRVVGKTTDVVNAFDVDASAPGTKYDPLTDGTLNLRYLFGLTGTPLTANALGGTATRLDAASIKIYLDTLGLAGDIDGNGRVDALTDGLLVLRYIFGLRGVALIANAVDPAGTRKTAADIEAYLLTLMP